MPPSGIQATLQHLRTHVAPPWADGVSDRQLLSRYAARRDEEAFAEVVRRHGPMVLGVCRRLLRNGADAEDAFQATFLVLARRAGSVRAESAGGWLHGIACRVAANARRAAARRPGHEPVGDLPRDPPDPSWSEVMRVLDEELDGLPEKYRVPLVLCYLEGKTRDEAARELGCGVGVLRGRLDRAREGLRRRLTRRGLTLPAALLGAAVADGTIPARLAAAVVRSAVSADAPSPTVLTLTQGVLNAMRWKKVKAAVLGCTLLACGAAGLVAGSRAPAGEDKPTVAAPEDHPALGEVRFPDGGSVTLLRVERPALGKSWRPDGTGVEEVAKPAVGHPEEAGRPEYVFTFLVKKPPAGSDPGYWSASFGDGAYGPTLVTSPEASKEPGETVVRLRVRYATPRDSTRVEYGFASRGWKVAAIRIGDTVRTFDWPGGTPAPEVRVEGIDRREGFKAMPMRSEVVVRMPEKARWSAGWRVLVTDRAGKVHHPAQWGRLTLKPGELLHEFEPAPGDIGRVELLARYYDTDYRWASFAGVSLTPAKETKVTGSPGRKTR